MEIQELTPANFIPYSPRLSSSSIPEDDSFDEEEDIAVTPPSPKPTQERKSVTIVEGNVMIKLFVVCWGLCFVLTGVEWRIAG